MYYIEKDNRIVLKDNNLETITSSRDNAYPQYKDLEIKPTDKNIVEFESKFYFEDDEYYLAESLKKAKKAKYNEANTKAKEYLESGDALYEFDTDKHIEATDGNIAKIGLKATALLIAQDLETTFPWNTKEDINIQINALEGKAIAEGLGAIQDEVWTVKFPAYIEQIEQATTIEEVDAIVINYDD